MKTAARCLAVLAVILPGFVPAAGSASAADISPAFDVAPKVEKTRLQKWPRAAWAAESKCWLVVWREGDLNERETDIWCARVSADGKPLDEAGIKVSGAKGIQDHPVVASDGRNFLVAWQDMRGGKDWDVYAARVSGDGKAMDADGIPVAGGEHNQCLPTLAFAGGKYHSAWQSWVEDAVEAGFGSYEVNGARISPDGKVLDPEGIQLAGPTALQPSLASDGGDGLAVLVIGRTKKGIDENSGFPNMPGLVRLDPESGKPLAAVKYPPVNKNTGDINYVPGVTMTGNKSCLVTMGGWRGGMVMFQLGEDGEVVGECQAFRASLGNQCIVPISSISCGGGRALMTYDFPSQGETVGKQPWRMKVWGWIISPDGKILEGGQSGFLIAAGGEAGGTLDCMQAAPSAGPDGTFLVVCSEARGVEDTKVAGRLVK